jgi:hypothetical protein
LIREYWETKVIARLGGLAKLANIRAPISLPRWNLKFPNEKYPLFMIYDFGADALLIAWKRMTEGGPPRDV